LALSFLFVVRFFSSCCDMAVASVPWCAIEQEMLFMFI